MCLTEKFSQPPSAAAKICFPFLSSSTEVTICMQKIFATGFQFYAFEFQNNTNPFRD
jgi:hypothetical protein